MHGKRFVEIVERCYASLEDPACLNEAHHLIGRAIGADAGDIVTECTGARTIETLGSFGFDPEFLRNYDSDFLGENPWVENLVRLPRNRFHTDEADPPEFVRSTYFNEWVRPQGFHHTIGAVLSECEGRITWAGYTRMTGRPQFDDDAAFLNRLMPHLRRTVSLRNRMCSAQGEWASLSVLLSSLKLPLLVVDGARRVVFFNEAADRFMRRSRLIRVTRGGLLTASGAARERLSASLVRAARMMDHLDAPPDQTVLIEQGGEAVAAAVIPLCGWQATAVPAGRAAVLLSGFEPDAMPDLRAFAARYGLTDTETELARCIASGKGILEFAELKGIAVSTARWHLKNLEAKAGVSRAEQLATAIYASIFPIANRASGFDGRHSGG